MQFRSLLQNTFFTAVCSLCAIWLFVFVTVLTINWKTEKPCLEELYLPWSLAKLSKAYKQRPNCRDAIRTIVENVKIDYSPKTKQQLAIICGDDLTHLILWNWLRDEWSQVYCQKEAQDIGKTCYKDSDCAYACYIHNVSKPTEGICSWKRWAPEHANRLDNNWILTPPPTRFTTF